MRETTRKKRDAVLQTALRLFQERGYETVSVDDIIAETQTSKGTFYHYFGSKEAILSEIGEKELQVVERWAARTPSQVLSLEGHVNRLFIDLSSNSQTQRLLVRSLFLLTLQSEEVRNNRTKQINRLRQILLRWLPDATKVETLICAYLGTLYHWAMRDDGDVTVEMRERLRYVWHGLNAAAGAQLQVEEQLEEKRMRVAIIGGGLAGLTAAAYLSEEPGIEGVVFERSPHIGGRAFTYEKAGFTLNYGAHAIYGIDRHTIHRMERELGLSFSHKQVDKRRVFYEKNGQTTIAPLDFINLMKTELLDPIQKVRFVGEITAIIANIHKLRNYETLGDWLAESDADEDVKELWEHLVCSNFFISPEDARRVPGPAIAEYYQNLFLSSRPVNYILGSWAVITNQLRHKIELSGRWRITLQEGVDEIRYENRQYMLRTKTGEHTFDRIVFAMPVQQTVKILRGTPWEPFIAAYEANRPTEVLVYDLGLKRIVARPFHYISDMERKMFISDVSATDDTLIPPGSQLLQGIAYLNDVYEDEAARKTYLDGRLSMMEELFDKHYPGWRDAITVKRVSKKAMVQSVKRSKDNRPLPVRLESVPFLFCGDGCDGKGELAERAFSTAREAARLLLHEVHDIKALVR